MIPELLEKNNRTAHGILVATSIAMIGDKLGFAAAFERTKGNKNLHHATDVDVNKALALFIHTKDQLGHAGVEPEKLTYDQARAVLHEMLRNPPDSATSKHNELP